MKTPDKERKNMALESVHVIISPENDYVTKRSGIAAAIDKPYQEILKGIAAQTKQGIPTHGITTNLGNKFDLLCKAEFKMISAGSAYFASIEDVINRAKVEFTLPQVEANHHNGIASFCDGTLLTITPTIAALLGPFGGSVIQRTDVVNKLAAYRSVETSTEEAIDARVLQTADIHPFIMKSIEFLELYVDPIVNTMLEDYPDHYALYWNARKINHFPHGTTTAEGYMLDPEGHPIYNGQVFFPSQNITLHTLLDGSFTKPHFPFGIAAPVASAPGFHPNVANPYQIKKGKTVSHIFNMVRI